MISRTAHWFRDTSNLILVGILTFALILRLPGFNESIWYDELWSTSVRLEGLFTFLQTILTDNHPPFYSFLMKVWIGLFGDSEVSIRIPALISGLASIALAYTLAGMIFGRRAAVFAALFLCLSPTHIWYSQEARAYALLMATATLAIYSFLKALQTGYDRTLYWTYVFSAVAMTGSHYYGALILGIISVFCLLESTMFKRKVLRANLLIAGALANFLILMFFLGQILTGQFYMRRLDLLELWGLSFNWFPTGNTVWAVSWQDGVQVFFKHPLMTAFQVGLAILLFLGIRRSFRWSNAWRREAGLVLISASLSVPVFLLLAGLVGLDRTYIERSLLIILPFFAVLLGGGISSIRVSAVRTASAAVVLALVAWSSVRHFQEDDDWTVYKQNPDWRSASAYLGEDLEREGYAATLLGTSPLDVLPYYDARLSTAPVGGIVDRMTAGALPIRQLEETVYLIVNLYREEDYAAIRERLLESRYEIRGFFTVKGVEILKLHRQGQSLRGSPSSS